MDSPVVGTRTIELDTTQNFESGKYVLTDAMSNVIGSEILDMLSDNVNLVGVYIESSTDKQRLSISLQNELKSKGFDGDNIGLSKARCKSISDFITSIGVDSSIIETKNLHEIGDKEIDRDSRYIKIKLMFIEDSYMENPAVSARLEMDTVETYFLSKEKVKKKNS